VRVLEVGGDPDLPAEPLLAQLAGGAGEEDLERDRALVAEVVGEVDHGHAAPAEDAIEAIVVAEGGG
jgi:hypothetical protein